jgi:hypothetical protein
VLALDCTLLGNCKFVIVRKKLDLHRLCDKVTYSFSNSFCLFLAEEAGLDKERRGKEKKKKRSGSMNFVIVIF